MDTISRTPFYYYKMAEFHRIRSNVGFYLYPVYDPCTADLAFIYYALYKMNGLGGWNGLYYCDWRHCFSQSS